MIQHMQHSIKQEKEQQEQQKDFLNDMQKIYPKLEEMSEKLMIMMEANATIFEEIIALKGGDAVVQDGQAIGSKKIDKKGQ